MVAMTAATGTAAINVKGQTLHRWAGILLGNGTEDELLRLVRRKSANVKKWKNIEILLIDEISMIGASLFDKLDYIAKNIRQNDAPFGGIQLIVSGDFLQLQPIKDKFAFESEVWNKLDFHVEKFTIPYRYTDINFFEVLQRVRLGEMTDNDIQLLKSRIVPYIDIDNSNIKPSMLNSLVADVSDANLKELDKLEGRVYKYTSRDTIPKNSPRDTIFKMLDSVISPLLVFKVGAESKNTIIYRNLKLIKLQ